MWHDVPMSDDATHGFFKYHPKIFWHLRIANGYELIQMRISRGPSAVPVPEKM